MYQISEQVFYWVHRGYEITLRWALRNPRFMLMLEVSTVALTIGLFKVIPKGFFPEQDIGRISGIIQAEQSISFQAMQKKLAQVVDIIRSDRNVQDVVGFTGGGGDFGTRYAWYVRVVQQKVSENWLKYEVDPRIAEAQRVYLVFDIGRDGRPSNVQVEQSSGVPSLDQSAVRAIQRIDTFGPLPSDYSGNKVSVEFWFDYKR